MVIKNALRRIGIVFVLMGIFSAAMGITIDPPGTLYLTNNNGESRTFLANISDNATVNWYLNNTPIWGPFINQTSASYPNSSASEGIWNVSVVAVNSSNSSDLAMTTWWWTVNPAASIVGSPPVISGEDAVNIKDTTVDITFTVDQSDAHTVINYSTDSSLSQTSTEVTSGTSRSITLTGLTKSTSYNYRVFAINGSNSSYSSNSTIKSFTTLDPTTPEITNVTNNSLTSTSINIVFEVNQSNANTSVIYSNTDPLLTTGTTKWNNNSGTTRTIQVTPLSSSTLYYYRVNAYNATNPSSYSSSSSIDTFTTKNPAPSITSDPTSSTIDDMIVGQSKIFKVTPTTQDVTVNWTLDGSLKETDIVTVGQEANYTFAATSQGNFTLIANASNANGSVQKSWTINVHSKTYASGNRIWDQTKDMNTKYTWSPMSFYAFYYDVDDNVGSESLEINLNSRSDRTVRADQLIYRTAPEAVSFKYDKWGKYNVIGFMADKYFAGYTASTTISDEVKAVSTLNYKQLHKVLMDDKDTHSLRASTTFPLGDGYALSLKDIGTGRVAMISITKDGGEVDNAIVEVGETYSYSKKVGSINDLPIIVLHIGTVFMGTTESMVQINGIFQISESYTSVSQNNNYGMMEIRTVGDSGITMKNENSFTLSSGSTIDIMGDMKFIVANNDSVLRFAPMVKKTGEYEVRGTISNNETESLWTPLSFEGFYYNIDEDIGTESLKITRTDRNIGINNIEYSTSSAQVSHKYSALGKYNVIGFMAEKYFAGYEVGLISDRVISTMGRNQLHKVLIDDDTQRIIYAGSTLTLNDGYVIKIKDVNMGAGSAEVWLSVLKDGNEVGDGIKSNGQVFTFEKDVGAVKDLPIIALRIQNIFRGKEATAAFVKGTFQISESYKTVKQGDNFDKMEVKTVSANTITMKNPSAISLDAGSSDTLMGKMRLKVADSSDIRYYPYILFNGSALAANQLAISVPSSMMVKDVITISVTSGAGTNADNAEVSFDGQVIGTTNSTGKLDYMLTKAGRHNLTATKLGFEKATKTVQISEYVDNRLSFELPEFIDQYIPVTIKVKVSGTGNVTSGVNVTFDGKSIGKTDSNGILTYTFTESGTHNLAASKPGYIEVQREISIRLPFIEFKALDINFRPNVVNKGQSVYVWANITNTGTKEGTLPVALIINSTVVENTNVTLAPGKQGVANFTHKVELLPGNYTVEVLGQKTTMPVKEEPLNLFLVAGIITVLGAISIIVLTSKEILNIEALKAKLNMAPATNKPVINTDAINRAIEDIKSKFKKK